MKRLFFLLAIAALAACSKGGDDGKGVTIDLAQTAEAGGPLPRVYGARDPGRPLVVLDPGHGGKDPGATSPYGGRQEKDVTLAVATRDPRRPRRVRPGAGGDDPRGRPLPRASRPLRDRAADGREPVHLDPRRRGAAIMTAPAARPSTPCPRSPRTARRPSSPSSRIAPTRSAAPRSAGDAGVNRILIDLAQRESMNISADFAAPAPARRRAIFSVPARTITASPRWSC